MKTVFTRRQIRRFLVNYHHLGDGSELADNAAIVGFVRKVGCIQFDPLDVVGKNPDLVLQSRCQHYRKGDIGDLLYRDRVLFDVWDKNMSIITVDDWPCFHRFRNRHLPWLDGHPKETARVIDYLRQHDYACSSDFDLEEKVHWWYGKQRLAKAILECLCYSGLAVVHHKKGTRRYYCLAEKVLPGHLLQSPPPHSGDAEYFAWLTLRRINAVGVLWNRPSDAWLGSYDYKSSHRTAAFQKLLAEKKIAEILVEGIKYPLYIARENLPLLEQSVEAPFQEHQTCRFLAPLDSLLWDRKLIAALFDFEYKWEVYTPVKQRKYGYYVLPTLCGDHFIGRAELAVDSAAQALNVKSFWWESNLSERIVYLPYLQDGLERFAGYHRCQF